MWKRHDCDRHFDAYTFLTIWHFFQRSAYLSTRIDSNLLLENILTTKSIFIGFSFQHRKHFKTCSYFSNTLQRGDMNIPLLNAAKIRLFSILFSISILGKQNKKGRLGKQCYTLLNIFTCYIKSCKIWKCMVNTLQFTWMNDIKCHHFVSKITTSKEKPNTLR